MAMLVWCEGGRKIRIPVDFLFHINGDMSERVMTLIESMVPEAEVYSIDESKSSMRKPSSGPRLSTRFK